MDLQNLHELMSAKAIKDDVMKIMAPHFNFEQFFLPVPEFMYPTGMTF